MNPHVTYTDAHGQRIYGIETPKGFVYLVANAVYPTESDAMRAVKTKPLTEVRVNPVIEAMLAERE